MPHASFLISLMLRTSYLRVLFLLFCVVFLFFKGQTQVKYAFTKDRLIIKGGQTFSNLLRVTNTYPKPVVLKQDQQHILLKGFISLPDTIVLGAGETRVFPVKYMTNRQNIKDNVQTFTVRLVAAEASISVQSAASFITRLVDAGGLVIGTEESEIYLNQYTNQAKIMVSCINTGFVPLSFRLLLNGIPEGLEFTGQTMNLVLQPGAQQLLPFTAKNRLGKKIISDFTVTIQALDNGNNQLAVKTLRVVNVTSEGRLGGNVQLNGDLPNSAALRYVDMDGTSAYYQFQSNGKLSMGNNSSLSYRMNTDYFRQQQNNGLIVYNSFIDYQRKGWGIKLGNIYENMDYAFGGRGIKANLNLAAGESLSAYGIQNDYFLFNQLNNSLPGAKVYALDYKKEKSTSDHKRLTVIHSKDPLTGVDASQLSTKMNFNLGERKSFGFEAGYSLEEVQGAGKQQKSGLSAGLNYVYEGEGIQFSGNGYYSSPYYTGIRRGLFNTDLRMMIRLNDKNKLTAHANLQTSHPEYQNNLTYELYAGESKNTINIYELGYSVGVGSVSLSFTPYLLEQRLYSTSFTPITNSTVDWKSSAARMAVNVGYYGSNQSFTLNGDYGYTYVNTSGTPQAPYHTFKFTGNYTYSFLGLSTYVQLNPYYLSDVLTVTGQNRRYHLYAIGPNVRLSAFNDALRLQMSTMYSHYGYTGSSNYSLNGMLRYNFKKNWALTGDALYAIIRQKLVTEVDRTDFASYERATSTFNTRQIRVGIEKQFGNPGNNNAKKLELVYYEDRNSNGQKDADEPAVPGVLVKINGQVALTDAKGKVAFKGMKKEAYTVAITNTKGWSLQEPTQVFLDKNKKMDIALVKTQALFGQLKIIAVKYGDGMPDLAGIRVKARDVNGNLHQTLTNDHGEFCFYLPRNEYTVYVETEGLPFSIENGQERVALNGSPAELLTFMYRDERRKIGVTRF